jgi:hypothetical protein
MDESITTTSYLKKIDMSLNDLVKVILYFNHLEREKE